MKRKDNLDILIIEDNSGDVVLTQEAFDEVGLIENIHIARDGEDALLFLNHKPPYENVPVPDLIILDLNLPKKDGRELLKELKSDEKLKVIPVIILTTSKSRRDILECYRDRANCYIEKPVDFDRFIQIVESIKDFWVGYVRLPSDNSNT